MVRKELRICYRLYMAIALLVETSSRHPIITPAGLRVTFFLCMSDGRDWALAVDKITLARLEDAPRTYTALGTG